MSTWSTDTKERPSGANTGGPHVASSPNVMLQHLPSSMSAEPSSTMPVVAERGRPLPATQHGGVEHPLQIYASHNVSPIKTSSWFAAPQQASAAAHGAYSVDDGQSTAYSNGSTPTAASHIFCAQEGSLSPERQHFSVLPAWQQLQLQQQFRPSSAQPHHVSAPYSALHSTEVYTGCQQVSMGQSVMPEQQQYLAGRLQQGQNPALHVQMLSRNSSANTLPAAVLPDVTSPPATPDCAASMVALQQAWHNLQQQQHQRSEQQSMFQQPYAVEHESKRTGSPLRMMTAGRGLFAAIGAAHLGSLQQEPQQQAVTTLAVASDPAHEPGADMDAPSQAQSLQGGSDDAAVPPQGVFAVPSIHNASYTNQKPLMMTAGAGAVQWAADRAIQASQLPQQAIQRGSASSPHSEGWGSATWEGHAPAETSAPPLGNTWAPGQQIHQLQGSPMHAGVHAAIAGDDCRIQKAAVNVHASYRSSLDVNFALMSPASRGPIPGHQQHMPETVNAQLPRVAQWHQAAVSWAPPQQPHVDSGRICLPQQLQSQHVGDERHAAFAALAPPLVAPESTQAAPSALQHNIYAQQPFAHAPNPMMYWQGMYAPPAAAGAAVAAHPYFQPAMIPMMVPAVLAPPAGIPSWHPANMVNSQMATPVAGQGSYGWLDPRIVPANAAFTAQTAAWQPQPQQAVSAVATAECDAGSVPTAGWAAVFSNLYQGSAGTAAGTVTACAVALGSATATAAQSSLLAVLWCGHLQLVLVLYAVLGITASIFTAQRAVWGAGGLMFYSVAQLAGLTRRELWLFAAAATRVVMSDLCQLPKQLLDQPWLQLQQQNKDANMTLMLQSSAGGDPAKTSGMWTTVKALLLPAPSISRNDKGNAAVSPFAAVAAAGSGTVSAATRQLNRQESQSWVDYISAGMFWGSRRSSPVEAPADSEVTAAITTAGDGLMDQSKLGAQMISAQAHSESFSAAAVVHSLTNNMLVLVDSVSVISGMWMGLGLKLWGLATIRLPYATVRVWVSAVWGGLQMAFGLAVATIPRVFQLIWCILHASLLIAVYARSHLHLPEGAVETANPLINRVAVKYHQAMSMLFQFAISPMLSAAWCQAATAADSVPGGLVALQLMQVLGGFFYAAASAVLRSVGSTLYSLVTVDKIAVSDLSAESIALRGLGMMLSLSAWCVGQFMAATEQVVVVVATRVLQGAPPLAQTAVWGSAGMLKRMSAEVVQQTWLLMQQMYQAWALQQQRQCTAE